MAELEPFRINPDGRTQPQSLRMERRAVLPSFISRNCEEIYAYLFIHSDMYGSRFYWIKFTFLQHKLVPFGIGLTLQSISEYELKWLNVSR